MHPGATVVGALPDDDDDEEEEDRSGGVVQIFELDRTAKSLGLDDKSREVDDEFDSKMRSKDYNKAKKVVKLLKKLLLE